MEGPPLINEPGPDDIPETATEEHESQIETAEALEAAVERGITIALDLVTERFENAAEKRDNLPFHNSRHTGDVVRRIDLILETAQKADPTVTNNHRRAVARLGAAYHDTIQDWEENTITEEDGTKVMRRRFTGDNEQASSKEAVAYMNTVNEEAGEEVFTEEDRQILDEGINDGTFPGFDPDKGTVIQPKLKESALLEARALALADLGTAGLDGPEAFLLEGDALFREENLDIFDALEDLGSISDDQKEYYQTRMLGWSKFQPVFAEGRKALLNDETEAIPGAAREAVRELFSRFDDTIEASKVNAQNRESMTFEELAVDMGYSLS